MTAKKHIYAGFAKVDITPPHPRGMSLRGMSRLYPGASGVLDPVYARTAYLESGAHRFLLMALDVVEVAVFAPHLKEVLAKIVRETGIPEKNIWLHGTHCHSSVGDGGNRDSYRSKEWSRYLNYVLPRIAEAGIAAFRRRERVEIGYGSARVERVASNRRMKTSEGIVLQAWSSGATPPPGIRLVERGPIDPELGVVVFRNLRHRPVGAILNYNTHIHLYPTQYFTPEFAGYAARLFERKLPGVLTVYTNGAEGNTSLDEHAEPQSRNPEDWNRQFLRGMNMFSNRLVTAAVSAYRKMKFASQVRMAMGEATVPLTLLKGQSFRVNGSVNDQLLAVAIDDLALLAEGEEAFVELALGTKAASPFPNTYVLGLVNMARYYFPTNHAMEEGGYECYSRLKGDAMRRMIISSGRLLRRLRKEMVR